VLIQKCFHVCVWSFRGTHSDSNWYLVVAEVSERLSASKSARQEFDMERFGRKELNLMAVMQTKGHVFI
jgi:hypothetical protein